MGRQAVSCIGIGLSLFMTACEGGAVATNPPPSTTYTLTVNSTNQASGVAITVFPADINKAANGTTSFTHIYDTGTSVTLTAPATSSGNNFRSWTGCSSTSGATCMVMLNADATVTANYALYSTNPPNENALQWKLDDNAASTTVAGRSMLNGFAQDGDLAGGSTTAQVASMVNGYPAFHLNGQYVSIDLSTIHPYEMANLWTKYSGNPVLSSGYPQDCEIVRNPNGPNGGNWYCFGSVGNAMDRFESTDLIHWTGQTEVLAPGGSGAWDTEVQWGYVFQDPLNGGVWILLYRGYNGTSYQIGLATSGDGASFTRKNNGGVNDGLFTEFGGNYDAQAVMLVGTTYYVYVNGVPSHQNTNVYYSTDDFNTFTAYPHNPIFVSGFCPTVWSVGSYYYMLIARDYFGTANAAPLSHGIALYRSTSPTFDPGNRQYLGYAVVNDQNYDVRYLDTPSIPMTDVYKTTYAPEFGNDLYMLYAGVPTSLNFSFEQSIASTALSGLSSIAPITEAVTESLSTSKPITFSFWVQFDSLTDGEDIFSLGGSPASGSPTWFATAKASGGNKVLALYLGGSYALTSFPLAANTPYQVTIVDNVSDKEVYINGTLVGTFTASIYYPYPNPAYLYIGAGGGTQLLQGYIYDFRIYPQGLSAAEAGDLYATGSIAPTISDIAASVTDSTAILTWKTDSAADSQVVYGLSSANTASSPLYSANAKTQRVLLTGLSPLARHHYAVESSIGTLSTSADRIFAIAR
jgi:hypothetical protein